MRWSKLKQIIESGFAPSVSGRVRVDVTRYRQAHDAEGRWAFVIDGQEVAGLGCIVADQEESKLIDRVVADSGLSPGRAQPQADVILRTRAHHTLPMFTSALFQFTNMSIDLALKSADPVVRALAALDRRLGRRRLLRLAERYPETDIERQCLLIRLHSENIEARWER